jgi:hypothetical protein
MFGGSDLQAHLAANQFEAIMGADLPPALVLGAKLCLAGAAHQRHMLGFSAHNDRQAAPMTFHSRLLTGRL